MHKVRGSMTKVVLTGALSQLILIHIWTMHVEIKIQVCLHFCSVWLHTIAFAKHSLKIKKKRKLFYILF